MKMNDNWLFTFVFGLWTGVVFIFVMLQNNVLYCANGARFNLEMMNETD